MVRTYNERFRPKGAFIMGTVASEIGGEGAAAPEPEDSLQPACISPTPGTLRGMISLAASGLGRRAGGE
jgi:hypothetical protein